MRSRTARLVTAVTLLSAASSMAVLGAVGTAGAKDEGDSIRVEQIDARDDPWIIEGTATAEPTFEVDDEAVDASVQGGIATDVVIVLDNDRSLGNGTVQLAKRAAATFLPGEHGIRRVAVVSTAREGAVQEQGWSTSPERTEETLDGIQQTGDAATWDALDRAASMLESSDAPSKRVVAFLSAPDQLSTVSSTTVERDLRLVGGRLDAVVLPQGVDSDSVALLVSQVGGSLRSVTSDEEFDQSADEVAVDLDGLFVAELPAPDGEAPRIGVKAGDAEQTLEGNPGELQVGSAELRPAEPSPSILDRLTSNSLVRWVALLLLLVGVAAGVWALLSLVVPDRDSLKRRLSVYDESAAEGDETVGAQSMTTVPILQRAVALTSDVAEKRGILDAVELSLERANLPLRAAEAVFFVGIAAVLLGIVGLLLSRNLLVALIVTVLAVVVPKAMLDMKVRSRQKKFVGQLPDTLSLLAGTLKAGYSVTQGFEAVSQEIEDPMGRELRRVVNEHRLGRTLEDALDATAERMDSEDFEWTVMAIKIQREVGGNLAELLLTVANTMVERERLRREVATLTAEGRISAIILGFLPPAMAGVLFVMNREYISNLFTPGLGYLLVALSVIAMVIGFAWMKKIITIEA